MPIMPLQYKYKHIREVFLQQKPSQRQLCTTFWVNTKQYDQTAFIALTDNLCDLKIGPADSGCRNAFEVWKTQNEF